MRFFFVYPLLLTLACSPELSVHSDFDNDYSLQNYRTFNWRENIEEDRNAFYYNEINDKKIKACVNHELAKRGYILSDSLPDLMLHYHIIVVTKDAIMNEINEEPLWLGMQPDVLTYQEGTLIIDIMDAKTNALIWRSWAVAPLIKTHTPEKTTQLIHQAVAKMFKGYPTKQKTRTESFVSH